MHGSWLLCSVGVVGLLASTAHSQSGRSDVIAVDVLIEPDAAMVDRARAVNEALRRDYPAGYALDASHAPHITLLQRFIRRGDLDAVSKAVAAEAKNIDSLSLNAIGCQLVEWGGIGLAVIVVESSPELRALEARMSPRSSPSPSRAAARTHSRSPRATNRSTRRRSPGWKTTYPAHRARTSPRT